MEDDQIIDLYWKRNADAIAETSAKYGSYCNTVAMNILGNQEDAQECVNDILLIAWNAIPPHRPTMLRTFLGKLARNISFNRYKRNQAQKRGAGLIITVLDELSQCVSASPDLEQIIDHRLLVETINSFLESLAPEKRGIFLCRYWYVDSIASIAKRYRISENNVSVTLNRLRGKLRQYLLERGFEI